VRVAHDRLTAWVRAEPLGSVLVYGALATVMISIATLLLAVESITPAQRATLLVVAIGAWIALVVLGWTRGTLPLRPVLVAIALTLLCAVATPSHQSDDVYAYAMYGRIMTEHHHNPYATYPMHFEGDPMRRHVADMWQRTPDIYGVGFTAIMAAVAPLIGESTFLAHFVYQLVAVAAVVGLLWLLWRRTRSPIALAFVGLHPLMAVSVVNGGHPDALIGLALFAGVLLALERRPVLAGLTFAFAVSINPTAIAAATVLTVWAYRRWSRQEVITFAAIVGALGALPYVFLSGWLSTAHAHAGLVSRQSIWTVFGSIAGGDALRVAAGNGTTLVAGALLLMVLIRHTRRDTPEVAIAAAIAAFLVASAWVMPWYGFAALPLLAIRRPNLLSWTVALYSAAILVGEQFPSLAPSYIGTLAHQLLQLWIPVAALVACVAFIVLRPRERAVTEAFESAATAESMLAASA
jgi:hypothetical protein